MFEIQEDFLKEEVRDGFTVSPIMKSTWAAELKTLDAIQTFCRKLPFESMTVTAPAGYKDILTTQYGDWNTAVKGTSGHGYPFYASQMEYFKFLGKM